MQSCVDGKTVLDLQTGGTSVQQLVGPEASSGLEHIVVTSHHSADVELVRSIVVSQQTSSAMQQPNSVTSLPQSQPLQIQVAPVEVVSSDNQNITILKHLNLNSL